MFGIGDSPAKRRGWWWALAVVGLFFLFQLPTLNYGTRINNVGEIPGYRVDPKVVAGSSIERDALAGESHDRESLDLWMTRFKLYSVEADEVYNIMALARIKPGQGQFDPHFYQYGGAYLYPLGVWYFALSKLGVVPIAGLDQMLAEPDRMDAVYVWGRLFVLLAACVSALILHATLERFAPPMFAVAGVALYLFCPATVMFTQILKPHWYGMVWCNAALFLVARLFPAGRLCGRSETALGLSIGLMVGSAFTFGPFAVMLWLALLAAVLGGRAPWRALVSVPALAVAVWVGFNPFLLLNRAAANVEAGVSGGYFAPQFSLDALGGFLVNSYLPGWGIAWGALTLVLAAREIIRPTLPAGRGLGLALVIAIVGLAVFTAKMSFWHINFRYLPYGFPLAALLVTAANWPGRGPLLAAMLVATLAQTAPLKLAYMDENHPEHSTRLTAARWIDDHVPAGSGICLGTKTPTPYDTPPFALARHAINSPDCGWLVIVEREMDWVVIPRGFALAQRFRPRGVLSEFPLVFSHVNPQISVYRRS